MNIAKKCRKTKGCQGLGNHAGPCYNRKGNVIPAAKPIVVVTVTKRNPDGTPAGYKMRKAGKWK